MDMTHLSLFSGVGGMDLAAEWAGFETIGQCEFADYPTKVLEKHWPNIERWRDVRELTADNFFKRTGGGSPTVISGGFPCQPHSQSGKRLASDDERNLWPEYRRIVGEIKPRWVVAENVSGLLSSEDGRFFRGILGDFAEMRYDALWLHLRASQFGAIHRRERVFIVAYSDSVRRDCVEKKQEIKPGIFNLEVYKSWWSRQGDIWVDYPWSIAEGSGRQERNDDGLPRGMDRLKAYGNAVVPQQAYPIFQAIAKIEADIAI